MGLKKFFANRSYSKLPSPNSASSGESNQKQRRGSNRWKWAQSRSGPITDESDDSGEEGSRDAANENVPGNDSDNGSDSDNEQNNPSPPPPISTSASPELSQATQYFEITSKEMLTRENVKKRYKRLSLIHHPDRNGNAEKSIQEMQMINHYYGILEEELDRLEKIEQRSETDPNITPCSSSNSNSSNDNFSGDDDKEEDKDRENEDKENGKGKGKENRKNSWRSSYRRNMSRRRSRSISRSRSSSIDPKRERRGRRASTEPKKRRRRRTSTERRQREHDHEQKRRDMERDTKRERDDKSQKMNEFRKKQVQLRKWNNQRSVEEKLNTALGRDQAYSTYTRQVQIYRDQAELRSTTGSQEYVSNGTTRMPTKPSYALMDCCNEDIVFAMRLEETGIAIEIIHQEIDDITEEWILLKMRTSTSTNAGPGVYKSASRRGFSVQLDWSYNKRILQLLTRPLDKDGNSILHYAVYLEDYEMISYLIQIARQNKIFTEFVCYKNCRKLHAGDFTAGCTWDNSSVPSLMATLTKEAVGILEKKKRRRVYRQQQQQDRRLLKNHPLADYLFNIFLCLVVGRYVTRSGWIVSWSIIVLAHLVEFWNKSPSPVCISKLFFFALHTRWYLLVRIISKGLNIIFTFGENIPIPWQLQLVCVSAIPFLVKLRYWQLQYLVHATIRVESAWNFGLQWIISQNATFLNGYTKHLVDYAILSVPFLAIQLFCAVNKLA